MKADTSSRKIFNDAVDLFGEGPAVEPAGNSVVSLKISEIRPFDHHPFRPYEGERLRDMVESIREHGILVPAIVRKMDDGYQMLAGHNRMAACREAGLKEIPAVIKEGLTDEEAYVYDIETNVMQRSFSEMLPTEKAAVLNAEYSKICGTMKRDEIRRELAALSGGVPGGHDDHRAKSRDIIAAEYGFSSRNAARYMRLNFLIEPLKEMVDRGQIGLLVAVDLSFLDAAGQRRVCKAISQQGLRLTSKTSAQLRKQVKEPGGELTEEKVAEIASTIHAKNRGDSGVSFTLPRTVCEKYFEGMGIDEMTEIVEAALDAWFERKEME